MRKFQKVAILSLTSILALTLTSCAAGPNAETRLTNKVTDGNEIVLNQNGNNIRINRLEENDALISISSNGFPAVITGETILRANAPLHFEGESANIKAVISGLNLVVGTNVQLTLGFARAGIKTVNVIVRDQSEIYADVTSQPSSL